MAHRNPVILIAAFVSAASEFAQPAAPPPRATEELIGERPENAWRTRWTDTRVSDDLRKVVWLSRSGVVVNGETLGPPADEFLAPELSPDGQHVLRAGRQGKSWFVWLDTQQIAGPFDEVRRAHFAPDGRVVFAAKRAQSWTWFVDGKEQPVTVPALRQDGVFCKGGELPGLWDPIDSAARDAIERCWDAFIAVARDRVAYSTKQVDGWHLVVDGQIGPPFERIIQITFSPDGSRLAYLGTRKHRVVAVVDGKEEPARDAVEGLRFSADSKRVTYLAVDTSKDVMGRVVADGAPSRAYPALIQNFDGERAPSDDVLFGFWRSPRLPPYLTGASAPLFRTDGKVIYAARTRAAARRTLLEGVGLEAVPDVTLATGNEGIWVEGSDQPLFPASLVVSGPAQSEVGEHVGWVEWDALAGKLVGFVDGQPGAAVPGTAKRSNGAEHVTLSRDGSRLAFVHVAGGSGFTRRVTRQALRRVVATGLEDKPYDAFDVTNLRFSDDGKHLAYEVHFTSGFEVRGKGLHGFMGGRLAGLVVLDGVPGRAYTDVLPGSMRFVGPDAVRYVARAQETKGGPFRYYRVTQTAP